MQTSTPSGGKSTLHRRCQSIEQLPADGTVRSLQNVDNYDLTSFNVGSVAINLIENKLKLLPGD
jgi:hypothetical protein